MKRLLRHVTYANVTATLALFIALATGGAYAATQLAPNSVGKKQLRKNAVDSRALKNSGVALKDLGAKARDRIGTTEHAHVNKDGSLTVPSGGGLRNFGTATSATFSAPNSYEMEFRRDVSRCTAVASAAVVAADDPMGATTAITSRDGRSVGVTTFDANGVPVPASFNLILAC